MRKRGITIVVVVILGALALATWGGTQLGDSPTVLPPEEVQKEINDLTDELAQATENYIILQQDNDELDRRLSEAQASLSEIQTLYNLLQQENSNLKQTNATLTGENAALAGENAGLETVNANLEAKLASIESSLTGAQTDYLTLQQTNTQLRAQLTTATNELSALQNTYRILTQNYNNLQTQLSTSESNLFNLQQQYQALVNAKQFTVDNRLRVNLSTEMQSGGTTWVRGEVTNISGQAISRVYVVVSRYAANHTLTSMDLPPSVILNLAPGGTGYFSYFTTGELTEITVYGDY
jgi:predicted nuclease with TOPRIM domain